MKNHPLIILVGVTGVGKTTTVTALKTAGLDAHLLPNRRTLTDDILIPAVQQADGRARAPITDRAIRFRLTARYRQMHPGGMAHALAKLPPPTTTADWYLFDGLRGAAEVGYAAAHLPRARFLVLDAPHYVRVRRLLGRTDPFDRITPTAVDDDAQTADLLPDTDDLFTAEQKKQLLTLVHTGHVTAPQLQAKVEIVQAERQNYDPAAAIDALQTAAPQRTFVADTVALSPDQIAESFLRWVGEK